MTNTPNSTDIAAAVEIAKRVQKYPSFKDESDYVVCVGCQDHDWIEKVANALIALSEQREEEARDRKVQDKLDANARRDNAAFWDDVVTIRDATIARLECERRQLAELAKGWLKEVVGSGEDDDAAFFIGLRLVGVHMCARALLKVLMVEEKVEREI